MLGNYGSILRLFGLTWFVVNVECHCLVIFVDVACHLSCCSPMSPLLLLLRECDVLVEAWQLEAKPALTGAPKF